MIQTIVDIVPPPSDAQRTRIPKMLYPDLYESTIEPKNKLEEDLYACRSSADASVVALVSKMFAIPTKELPGKKKKVLTADEMRSRAKAAREARAAAAAAAAASVGNPSSETTAVPLEEAMKNVQIDEQKDNGEKQDNEDDTGETLLGFARIYSGTIRVGTTIVCVLPKYNQSLGPTHPRNTQHLVTAQVEELYTMMGRELVPVQSVPAGNVFAVKGLEGKVWRNATLCAPETGGVGDTSDLSPFSECLMNMAGVIRYVCRYSFCQGAR